MRCPHKTDVGYPILFFEYSKDGERILMEMAELCPKCITEHLDFAEKFRLEHGYNYRYVPKFEPVI